MLTSLYMLAAAASLSASGRVVDAHSGLPIAGALVQQVHALSTAFTADDGSFKLDLEPAAPRALVVSAEGYEDRQLPVVPGTPLVIRLVVVSSFLPAAPLTPQAIVGTRRDETAPLGSGLRFGYALRQNNTAAPTPGGGTASITGLTNNDFRLGARLRWQAWLGEAEGSHFEQPVNVAGLLAQDNPAYNASTWQAGARGGYVFKLNPALEVAPMLSYLWSNTVPNNNRIPYTGSALDFEQTRQAIGGYVLAAWRPGLGRWHLEAGGGYAPFVLATAVAPGTTFAASNLTTLHSLVDYELLQGFRLGLGVDWEHWGGTGDDTAIRYTAGIHYMPGGVPGGDE